MKILICLILFFISFNSYSAEENSSLDIVEKVEKNLIYSKEVEKNDPSSAIIIKKGGWNQEDTKKIEDTNEMEAAPEKKIVTEIKTVKEDKTAIALKRKAYDAINIGEYEIAVELYKQVLKINSKDIYATLGLATAYQYLGQYIQAKPLYLEVLEAFPTDQQVMANLLAIVADETPYEAVYLLSNVADKNPSSPLIQAQASIAYTKIKDYRKAIEYINKAIALDSANLEYRYNLAVLYDMNQDISEAKVLYEQLLSFNGTELSNNYNLPFQEIQNRLDTLNFQKKKRK